MRDRRYRVVLAPDAERRLSKLETTVQRRIIRALHELEVEPRPRGAAPLAGRPGDRTWRIRLGDYRVIYEIRDDQLLVLVVRLGHRGEVYRSR